MVDCVLVVGVVTWLFGVCAAVVGIVEVFVIVDDAFRVVDAVKYIYVLFIVGDAVAVAVGDGVVVVMVIDRLVVFDGIDIVGVATEFAVVADAFRLAVVEGVNKVAGVFDSAAEIGMIV